MPRPNTTPSTGPSSLWPSEIRRQDFLDLFKEYDSTIQDRQASSSAGASSSSSSSSSHGQKSMGQGKKRKLEVQNSGNLEIGDSNEVGDVAEMDLIQLEEWRLRTLPAIVRSRRAMRPARDGSSSTEGQAGTEGAAKNKMTGKARPRDTEKGSGSEEEAKDGNGADDMYLTKEEVKGLVRWKLKHGKFRPTLMSLVDSNPPDAFTRHTRVFASAFASNSDSVTSLDNPSTRSAILAYLSTMVKHLRGIGPATASLIGSVLFPSVIPFFSDEVARWLMSEPPMGQRSSSPWDLKLKYDLKEYAVVLENTGSLIARLNKGVKSEDGDDIIGAREVEMVGYVLGRKRADLKTTTAKNKETEQSDGRANDRTEKGHDEKHPSSARKRTRRS